MVIEPEQRAGTTRKNKRVWHYPQVNGILVFVFPVIQMSMGAASIQGVLSQFASICSRLKLFLYFHSNVRFRYLQITCSYVQQDILTCGVSHSEVLRLTHEFQLSELICVA